MQEPASASLSSCQRDGLAESFGRIALVAGRAIMQVYGACEAREKAAEMIMGDNAYEAD